jgi:hypothetical protein
MTDPSTKTSELPVWLAGVEVQQEGGRASDSYVLQHKMPWGGRRNAEVDPVVTTALLNQIDLPRREGRARRT